MIGWPFDTTPAVSRLIFSGVLDKFENLRVITHHLGRMLPYIEGRIHNITEAAHQGENRPLSATLETYLGQIYGDTAINAQGS